MKNYYAVLGLQPNAVEGEIKAAYRQSAKRYHPDLNPDNEAYKKMFLEVRKAYDILSNPETKAAYDAQLVAYIKARHAVSHARPVVQTQTVHRTQMRAPVDNKQKTVEQQLAEQKKIHAIQIEMLRMSAKEEMLKFRQQTLKRFNAHKERLSKEREREKNHNKSLNDKLNLLIKKYRKDYKKDSYNAGYKRGLKDSENSFKKNVEEWKKLIEQSDGTQGDSKSLRAAKLELKQFSVRYQELERKLHELERATDLQERDLQKQQDQSKEVELLAKKCEQLQEQVSDYEQEIDTLNDELVTLEELLKIWREVGADNTITPEELEMIDEYENAQMRTAQGTLYGVLGLVLNALPDEIVAAYTRLKKRYSGKDNLTERLQAVEEAYKILSSEKDKKDYDEQINNQTEF